MKLSLSLLLCGVLVCCLSLTAAEETEVDTSSSMSDSDEEFDQCMGQYLKSKGKLDMDVQVGKKSSMCLFGMQIAVHAIRDIFKEKVKMYLPEHVDCVMTEYDNVQVIDQVFKMAFVTSNKTMPESEKKTMVDALEKEAIEMMDSMAAKCGIEKEKFDAFRAREMPVGSSEEVMTTATTA